AVDQRVVRTADYEVQAGSLPGVFRRSESAFPRHSGYLRADATRIAAWRQRLEELGGGVKVGLSWRGGSAKTRTRLRTIPIAQLAPLLGVEGCTFVSLQYGPCEAEIRDAVETLGVAIHHFPEVIPDYDETAALVSALDIVVTVCTSIVHLSGALDRQVWVLVPSVPEWRYCFRDETLPWYPSARLFRQAPGESWERTIAQIAAGVRALDSRPAIPLDSAPSPECRTGSLFAPAPADAPIRFPLRRFFDAECQHDDRYLTVEIVFTEQSVTFVAVNGPTVRKAFFTVARPRASRERD